MAWQYEMVVFVGFILYLCLFRHVCANVWDVLN